MTEPYKSEYSGLSPVAVKVKQGSELQQEIHAPAHEAFLNDDRNPRLVKCPFCSDAYSIGYSRIHRTRRSFESLEAQLKETLVIDHQRNSPHRLTITLGQLDKPGQ